MSNEKEVIACVTLLAGALRQELTAPLLQGFCMALVDLSEQELRKAVGRALTECKFFPSPAELRAFAGRKALTDRGEEAWSIVRAAMDTHDWTVSVDFGPVVNATIRQMGGWQWLCTQSLPNLVWRQKEFVAAFQVLALAAPDEHRGALLKGGLSHSPVAVIDAPGSSHGAQRALSSRAQADVSDIVRSLADSKGAP